MIKIAIDGLSGSGKGALAEGLSKNFNLKHLDTGAIFRTMGIALWKQNILNPTEKDVRNTLDSIKVEINFNGNEQQMFLNGNNITHLLREEVVSQMASKVSAFSLAREKYLEIVSEFSKNYDCVIDGRDITSIVLPNADVKFYLTADETTRAMRRFKENQTKGITTTFEEVLKNLQERDYRDTHRDVAPLIIVDDAIVIDNTNMNIDETVTYCTQIVKNKIQNQS